MEGNYRPTFYTVSAITKKKEKKATKKKATKKKKEKKKAKGPGIKQLSQNLTMPTDMSRKRTVKAHHKQLETSVHTPCKNGAKKHELLPCLHVPTVMQTEGERNSPKSSVLLRSSDLG